MYVANFKSGFVMDKYSKHVLNHKRMNITKALVCMLDEMNIYKLTQATVLICQKTPAQLHTKKFWAIPSTARLYPHLYYILELLTTKR